MAKMIKYGEVRAKNTTNYHNAKSTAMDYYLEHPIIVDGTQYMVNMDIRKVPETNGRFYIHSINTKKIGTLSFQFLYHFKFCSNNNFCIFEFVAKQTFYFHNAKYNYFEIKIVLHQLPFDFHCPSKAKYCLVFLTQIFHQPKHQQIL